MSYLQTNDPLAAHQQGYAIASQRARPARLAFFLEDLEGGGVQKTVLLIAGELAARGHQVEVVVCQPKGVLLTQLPAGIELVELEGSSRWVARSSAFWADPAGIRILWRPVLCARKFAKLLPFLRPLVKYLRRARPNALFSATPYMNVEAWLARRLASIPCRLVLSEHNDLSPGHPYTTGAQQHYLPRLCRRAYLQADAIVAVSKGVAHELACRIAIPNSHVKVIYNPVVTLHIEEKARQPLTHPWFASGCPPVILGVGRIGAAKDFPTLVRAFAHIRRHRLVRLVILGQGKAKKNSIDKREAQIRKLANELGISDDVDMPGYALNPYSYMSHAAVLAVSSKYEGLCNVLIEAMACGTPVVSTNCPSGPAEILENGKYGPLVAVGDAAALADAIRQVLDFPLATALLRRRANFFNVQRAVDSYEQLLVG